ncbi:lonely Cys domain-containing protein [Streptomyces marokkonensis]|uniref:Lonely Cys domain-containing protein n=1 Tax=Streptomyces marokkonensis TaxID=324855 RepID=A0ABW6QII0_9ACTN
MVPTAPPADGAQVTEQSTTARRRGRTARTQFLRMLARALHDLLGLRAGPRIPADWVGTGALGGVTRSDMGRQAVFSVSLPPDAAAVQTLDTLRGRERALRAGPLDVAALARRVLHLDPGAAVDQDAREELFGLVDRATAAGAATSLATLGAFHLAESGVLAPDRERHFTVGGRRVPGLNWYGDGICELHITQSDHLEVSPNGDLSVVGTTSAPWPTGVPPYVVSADGRHDRVEALLPDGSARELGVDEFVELVAADISREGLPEGTPIVLAVPFAADGYLDLPRELADRTGLTVWAHSGEATLGSGPGGSSSVDTVRRPDVPLGDWIASPPGRTSTTSARSRWTCCAAWSPRTRRPSPG